MSPQDEVVFRIWQQDRRNPVARARLFRAAAMEQLHLKWCTEARMGDPEYDEGELRRYADEYHREFVSLMKLARFELRFAKEKRNAA